MALTAASVQLPWVPWPASPRMHSQGPCWLRSCRRCDRWHVNHTVMLTGGTGYLPPVHGPDFWWMPQ